MKRIIAITIAALAVLPAFAQRNITAKADKAFELGKYFDAIDEYKYAFAKAKDKDKKNLAAEKAGLEMELLLSRSSESAFARLMESRLSERESRGGRVSLTAVESGTWILVVSGA